MKNHLQLGIISCLAVIISACTPAKTTVTWIEGEINPETGKVTDELLIINPPKTQDWSVWFCQFKSPINVLEGSDGNIVGYDGSLYRAYPTVTEYKDTIRISYEFRNLPLQSWAPDGFTIQTADGKTAALETTYKMRPEEAFDLFDYNKVDLAAEDMIPALKEVVHLDGTTTIGDYSKAIVTGQKAGWYKITINGDVKVEAADEDGLFYAGITLDNIKRNVGSATVPNMVIEDWPDLAFRGLMLDVSRNFTTKDNVLRLIEVLAHYKVNVLHLHLGDDEGWRLAIDGLPELTSYSSVRRVPTLDKDGNITEPDGLMPSYSLSYTNGDNPSDGHYTKEDFIEILKTAKANHIKVIPEFDTPGHSRAAIKAMEYRFKTTGDATYLLSSADDQSKYMSVQDYRDNAINVALPSTYAFIEKVFDSIIATYKEAGAELTTIHIGGDEVPSGAWLGDPTCQKLMQDNGWTDPGMLKDYYISKVMDIAASRGLKIAGWQEVAQHLSPETAARLTSDLEYTNLWSTLPGPAKKDELPYTYANQGIGVVLSNVTNTYADMAYNYGRTERGHQWGGFIDERRSFSFLPFDLYKSVRWDDYGKIADISNASTGKTTVKPGYEKNILGVQAQLWTETIRNFDHVTYYIFPKVVGIFERGWNAYPDWKDTTVSDDPAFVSAFDRYYTIIAERESKYLDSLGITYRAHK